jgi:hypothetical protein
MVVPIIVVVVDLEDFVDGEKIRFVAIANIAREYHASRKFQPKFIARLPGRVQRGAPFGKGADGR